MYTRSNMGIDTHFQIVRQDEDILLRVCQNLKWRVLMRFPNCKEGLKSALKMKEQMKG